MVVQSWLSLVVFLLVSSFLAFYNLWSKSTDVANWKFDGKQTLAACKIITSYHSFSIVWPKGRVYDLQHTYHWHYHHYHRHQQQNLLRRHNRRFHLIVSQTTHQVLAWMLRKRSKQGRSGHIGLAIFAWPTIGRMKYQPPRSHHVS